MNRYQRALLFSSYMWYFGEGLLGPLYAIFTQRVGGDVLELTGAYALYLVTVGALDIYIGKISDHYSKKHLMTLGYALNAVATFGYLFVDSPAKLFMIQGLLGVAAAFATPTWNSLFSIYENKKHAGEEWGLDNGGSQLVTGFAVVTGGIIITYFSFSFLFVLMGLVQIFSTIILLHMLHLHKHSAPSEILPDPLKEILFHVEKE
ncbi:Major Facilitator Superfamily protein [uncultured archaeon]|nr:Major Facilitator Superfamily protein [uncultured archaeon]